jgi:hypothetical protein
MNKKSNFLLMGVIILTSILISCTKGNDPGIVPVDEPVLVSFKDDVQPIFNQNCITCHPNSGNMSLLEDASYANLVDVISPEYGIVRVSPFHADSSVICMKLHGVEGYGFLMPLNGIPLDPIEIKTIEDWIDQGALDN